MSRPVAPSVFPEGPSKALLDELVRVAAACHKLATSLSEEFGLADSMAPIGAVNIIKNRLIACAEVIDGFYAKWASPAYAAAVTTTDTPIEKTHADNKARVAIQLCDLIVGAMSAIEFQARQTLVLYPGILTLDPESRPYWKAFIGRSHAVGMIDAARMSEWEGLLEIRNMIVHNNGVADKDLTIALANGFSVGLRKGSLTMVSDMRDVPLAIDWIAQAYGDWCRAYLVRAKAVHTI